MGKAIWHMIHYTFIAVSLLSLFNFPANSEPRASSPDEISRALGGDYWKPKGQREAEEVKPKPAPKIESSTNTGANKNRADLDLPIFDMDVECGPAGRQNIGRNICLQAEQSAYDELKSIWDELPPQMKQLCRSFDTYVGVRYRRIAVCVLAEIDKLKYIDNQTAHRKFKY